MTEPEAPNVNPPGTEPRHPNERHRLQVQMNDDKVTVPDAFDLLLLKLQKSEQYLVQVAGIDVPEMRNSIDRVREGTFWWNQFNLILRQIAEAQKKPDIVIANQMPPENAGARGIQLEQ